MSMLDAPQPDLIDPFGQDQPVVQDPVSLDQQLQRMQGVENTWTLPPLPDDVKVDLLAHPALPDAGAVGNFMYGIQADMNNAVQGLADWAVPPAGASTGLPVIGSAVDQFTGAPSQAQPKQAQFLPEDDLQNQFRKVWAGVAGQEAPSLVTSNAVRDMKIRAVGKGLLPTNTVIDGSWDPTLHTVENSLKYEDMKSRLFGNRPGAARTSSVLDLIDKWANPSSLAAGAVALGFLPDFEEVGKNFSDFNDDHNPLDLIKGAAGVALPILNDVLLFTGVSEAVAFGRVALLTNEARQALITANAAENLYRSAKGLSLAERLNPLTSFGLREVGAMGDISRFSAPSRFATVLEPGLGAGGEAAMRGGAIGKAGQGLNAWRNATSTLITKKAVQQAMRVGVLGQAETTLFPDLSSWSPIGGNQKISDRAEGNRQALHRNPVFGPVADVLSLPYMPPNIFEHGAFSAPIKSLASRFQEAASAVSANEIHSATWFEFIRSQLEAANPNGATKLLSDARKSSPGQALANHLAGGSMDRLGQMMMFVDTQAAIDARAQLYVTALGIDRSDDPLAWYEALHTVRNHHTNLIRPMDMNLDLNEWEGVSAIADARAGLNQGELKGLGSVSEPSIRAGENAKRQGMIDALLHEDPAVRALNVATTREAMMTHNARRQDLMDELLGDLTPEFLGQYLNDMDVVSVDRFYEMAGAEQRLLEQSMDGVKYLDPADSGYAYSEYVKNVPAFLDGASARSKKIAWFGGRVGPRSVLTVSRLNQPDRQEALSLLGLNDVIRKHLEAFAEGTKPLAGLDDPFFSGIGRPLLEHLADPLTGPGVQTLGTIAKKDLGKVLTEAFPSDRLAGASRLTGKEADYAEALRYVASRGGDPADAIGFLKGLQTELDRHPIWNRFDSLSLDLPLAERAKQLEARLPYIAGRVEVEPRIAKILHDQGYKAVAGPDFLFPHDMVSLTGPFGELNKANLRAISLGRALSNQDPNIGRLQHIAFERHLFARMFESNVPHTVEAIEGGHPWAMGSADQNFVWQTLKDEADAVRASQNTSAELAGGGLAGVGTTIQSGFVPANVFQFKEKQLHRLFDDVYGTEFASMLKGVLAKSRNLGWEYEGLGALESKLRANGWLKSYLQTFGKTSVSESLGEWNGVKRAGVGVLSGALALAQGANPATAAAAGAIGAASGGGPKQRGIGALAAGGAALAMGNDAQGALAAAASVGLNPASIKHPISPKLAVGIGAGAVAAGVGQAAGLDRDPAALLGAGLAVGGTAALRFGGAKKALDLFADHGWHEYSKIGESLATLRDQMRFNLNPFFDLRRYVKQTIRGATADLPEGVTVPLRHGLSSHGLDKFGEKDLITRFRAASHEWMDADRIDEMAKFSQDRGILGFSPTKDMAGMFGHLIRQGVDDKRAAEIVKNTLTYGGRTALEKSVNFVFFPFSFEKKMLKQLGRFMADDMGRTVVLHDAMKAYDLLNDRYDLTTKFEQHLPMLDELQKLNMFTHGISPGELGGVNAPILQALQASPLGGASAGLLNMFLPQGLHIDSSTDTNKLQDIVQRLVPAYRDVGTLLDDAAQQGHVLFSDSHVTDRAEVSQAYDEWDVFKKQMSEFAVQNDTTWDAFNRSPRYASVKNLIDQKHDELGRKYPAWVDAQVRAAANATRDQIELKDIKARPQAVQTAAEQELNQFADLVDAMDKQLSATGASFKNTPDAIPPEMYDVIRNVALAFARQGNGFESLYDRYFSRTFGPIEESMAG